MDSPKAFFFDVFLTYPASEGLKALGITNQLRAEGLRVWVDEAAGTTEDFSDLRLQQAVSVSRAFVLIHSSHTYGAGWPNLEQQIAPFQDPLEQERRLIVVRLD